MEESPGTLRTKDDRGRGVSMIDPYVLHLLRRFDSIPAEPLAEVARDLGSGLRKIAKICLVLGILGAVPGVISFAAHFVKVIQSSAPVFPLPWWLPLANLWVVPFVIWIGARQVRSGRIRAVMLRHHRCPHCGYDLRLLLPDTDDHATTCPECGCAWRLEDSPNA